MKSTPITPKEYALAAFWFLCVPFATVYLVFLVGGMMIVNH